MTCHEPSFCRIFSKNNNILVGNDCTRTKSGVKGAFLKKITNQKVDPVRICQSCHTSYGQTPNASHSFKGPRSPNSVAKTTVQDTNIVDNDLKILAHAQCS